MFKLPNLPYSYSSLDPYIDEQTMKIHHTKHHQAYIDNLNKALENFPDLQKKSLEELLLGKLPEEIKETVINNAGGHFNHSFFWKIMSPNNTKPEGEILNSLNTVFGSLEKFKEEFVKKAMSVFGSGWAWLVLTPQKELILKRHSFQNPPIINGNIPILGIDLWEHAYYLKYQNKKLDYIQNWWHVINWSEVEKNYSNNVHSSR